MAAFRVFFYCFLSTTQSKLLHVNDGNVTQSKAANNEFYSSFSNKEAGFNQTSWFLRMSVLEEYQQMDRQFHEGSPLLINNE